MNIVHKVSNQRYYLIDSIRGIAILNMLAFHLIYDLMVIFSDNYDWYLSPFTTAWERFICCLFILVSGISLNFTHNAYKRGIVLNIAGFAITAVTVLFMPNSAIWFGILNFLGCCMLILQPLRSYLDKIKPALGAAASLFLFAILYEIPQRNIGFFGFGIIKLPDELYQIKWLSFLGFRSDDFFSADYFPVIPWIFLFLTGYFVWLFIKEIKADGFFRKKLPVLDIIGRYSLWIYIAHQPLFICVLMLITPIIFKN